MKAAVLVVLACLVAVTLADLPPPHQKKPHAGPLGHPQKQHGNPLGGLGLPTHKSSSSRSHSSSSSKSHSSQLHADPEVLAKKALDIFHDADGSAAFDGDKVKEDTVAEVPPKHKGKKESHKSKKESHHALLGKLGSGSHKHSGSGSHKHHSGSGSHKHHSGSGLHKHHSGSGSHHGGSSSGSHSKNPRHNRPLFNFKDVPAGADAIVIRKHHFHLKHHGLVRKFANHHENVNLILVVDAHVPLGRPSKKAGDKKKRGLKKSHVDITGIKHNNLYIFDDKFAQLFPKKGSGSSKGTSSSKSSSGSSKHPGLLDKLKGGAAGLAKDVKAGLNKIGGEIKNAAQKVLHAK